jgi:dimethylamine corrinoid protein
MERKTMSETEIFKKLSDAVDTGNVEMAQEAAKEAIAKGVPALKAILNGLAEGMRIVGVKYEEKEYFLPDMLAAADAMYAGIELLTPHIPAADRKSKGKIVMGVVEGDVHDIGKNIVKIMLTASGYEIVDLGKDVPTGEFINKAKSEGAQVIAMSTLMTPTLMSMKAVEDKLKESGMKDTVKTIVGGGSVSEEWSKKIGSDAYGADSSEAVSKVKQLLDSIMAAVDVMKKDQQQ